MIPRDMIEKISNSLKIGEKGLIEKDLYLQGLLIELSKSGHFVENFAFKGGTCLTKAYFGYYRFSEDLDFTWINQKEFEGKTQNQTRKLVSLEINRLMQLFEGTAKKLELDFKQEKSNPRYVQLGGGNRFATFKFWYNPTANEKETFIKIQLNFIDKIIHKPKKRKLAAIAEKQKQELELEYPENAFLAVETPEFFVYSLEEIAAEKIRALLTRRGFKARDIIDLYMLDKQGITISSAKAMAFEKTKFALKYLKYAENLEHKHFDENPKIGEEQALLTKQPGKKFEKFAGTALKELNKLAEEFRNKLKQKP